MSLWTSAHLAAATAGRASAMFEANGVAFDSREVGPGDLFVALNGEATMAIAFSNKPLPKGQPER